MAHPLDHRGGVSRPGGAVRCVLLFVGFVLICYIVRPPFLRGNSNATLASCPPCVCDCSPESDSFLPMNFDAFNSSFAVSADCAKDDPEMNEEMKKDIISLLSEEITLQKNVTDDSLKHTKALIMDAKRTSSHYQKEAEKCNAGMEACEEARERAEAELIEERKLAELWETRAREYGWIDE